MSRTQANDRSLEDELSALTVALSAGTGKMQSVQLYGSFAASGIVSQFPFPTQGKALGLYEGGSEPDVLAYTPTVDDLYRQIIAARTDLEIGNARILEAINRPYDIGTTGVPSQSGLQLASAGKPSMTSSEKLVPITAAVRSVSIGVLSLCIFSILVWATSGFILVSPTLSIIMSTGAFFLILTSLAESAKRTRATGKA